MHTHMCINMHVNLCVCIGLVKNLFCIFFKMVLVVFYCYSYCSDTKSCLCDLMDCSMPDSSVLHISWSWIKMKKESTKGEMIGCHHWLSGPEFEQTPGDSERQRSLACCTSQGRKESNMTQQLNNMSIELVMLYNHLILCHPLLLFPSIFVSIRVFSNKSGIYIR